MVEAFHRGAVGQCLNSNMSLEGYRQQVEEQREQLLASSSLLKEAKQRSELAERRLLHSQDLLAVGSVNTPVESVQIIPLVFKMI